MMNVRVLFYFHDGFVLEKYRSYDEIAHSRRVEVKDTSTIIQGRYTSTKFGKQATTINTVILDTSTLIYTQQINLEIY